MSNNPVSSGLLSRDTLSREPWQWEEAHWRALVNQVRAGERLAPKRWKGGARCAVALSFDSDHETNELLDRHGVKASFYVPAVAALLHPEEQQRVVAEGHEIGIHGWIHELNSVLPYEVERDLMFRSTDTLEKITGIRPVGLRTPSWDFSPNTLRIESELGLLYDSSLMADEDCYDLLLDGKSTGIVEVPVEWIRDDAVYFMMNRFQSLRPYTPPKDVLDIFLRELDAAYESGGLFQLTMHPHIITPRSRIWILDEVIRHAKAKGDVWFATHAEVAQFVKPPTSSAAD
jgi:peptidoglycan-N-acetylglucosamine deacetylase